MAKEVFNRYEVKYMLSTDQKDAVIEALLDQMNLDPYNSGGKYYTICNIYYDTEDNTLIQRSLSRPPYKEKLRLRSYSPRDGFALLEMKQKDGAQQRKRSLRVSREEAEQLIQGRYSLLLDLDDPFAAECHSLLETLFYRPKVLIEYRRTAYLLPTNSIRITFDREIRAQTGHLDLFALSLIHI